MDAGLRTPQGEFSARHYLETGHPAHYARTPIFEGFRFELEKVSEESKLTNPYLAEEQESIQGATVCEINSSSDFEMLLSTATKVALIEFSRPGSGRHMSAWVQ